MQIVDRDDKKVVAVLVIGFALIISFSLFLFQSSSHASNFTLEDFYKCEEGMSYIDVAKTLGDEGQEVSKDRSNPQNEVYKYAWYSNHGGYAQMTFINGKLINKIEHDLKKESEL